MPNEYQSKMVNGLISKKKNFIEINEFRIDYFADFLVGFGYHEFRFLFLLNSDDNTLSDSDTNGGIAQLFA